MKANHAEKIIAIQALVARTFGIKPEELDMQSRKKVATIPRQVAIYLAKKETGASLTEIGDLFGGKHHTTILSAIEHIEHLRATDTAMNMALTMLQRDLKDSRSR